MQTAYWANGVVSKLICLFILSISLSITLHAATVLQPVVYAGSLLIDGQPLLLASEVPFQYDQVVLIGQTPVPVNLSTSESSAFAQVSAVSGGSGTAQPARIFAAAAGAALQLAVVTIDGSNAIDATVRVTAAASWQAGCEGYGSAIVRLRVSNDTFTSGCSNNVPFSSMYSFAPGVPIIVQYSATAVVALDLNPVVTSTSSAFAMISPTFVIDPNFQDRYTLQFSDGYLSNVIATPEPGSFVLVLIAILFLALVI